MNKIKTFVEIKKGRMPSIKPSSRNQALRRQKCPSVMIREIQEQDNPQVCKLLYEHFRSLTFPAIIYWLVQHVYDLLAIVLINACLLSLYNLLYFCLLFLVYLFVRARYEIEKHIKESCPDLEDVHKTYRSFKGSNFYVAYVHQHNNPNNTDTTQCTTNTTTNTTTDTNNNTQCKDSNKSVEDNNVNKVSGSGSTSFESGNNSESGSNNNTVNQVNNSVDVVDGVKDNSEVSNGVKHNEVSGDSDEVNDLNFSQSCQANEILGCVGITPCRNNPNVGQMVRLVVTKKRRNMKVGTRLLEYLEKKALEMGYNEIRVFTNNLNTAYLQFLKQHNFQIIQIFRRGLMRGDLIIWSKVLKHTEQPKSDFVFSTFGNAMFIPE